MIIATTDPYGNPQCPICHEPVETEGAFCGPEHWQHFHVVIFDLNEPIEMDYLDLHEQPWYSEDSGYREDTPWALRQENT